MNPFRRLAVLRRSAALWKQRHAPRKPYSSLGKLGKCGLLGDVGFLSGAPSAAKVQEERMYACSPERTGYDQDWPEGGGGVVD